MREGAPRRSACSGATRRPTGTCDDQQLALREAHGKGLARRHAAMQQLHSRPRAGAAGRRSETPPSATPTPKPRRRSTPNERADSISKTQRVAFVRSLEPSAQRAGRQPRRGSRDATRIMPRLRPAGAATFRWPLNGRTSSNLFGVKARQSWRGVAVPASTTEYGAGHVDRRTRRRLFRPYGSAAPSFGDCAHRAANQPALRRRPPRGGNGRAGVCRSPAARRLRHRPGLCDQSSPPSLRTLTATGTHLNALKS